MARAKQKHPRNIWPRRVLVMVSAALLTLAAPSAFAVMPGVGVAGYCYATAIGPIASATDVSAVSAQITSLQGSLAMQLQRLGAAVSAGNQSLASTIDTQFRHEDNLLQRLYVQSDTAQIRAQTAINESPNNTPQNMCDAPSMAAGVLTGGATARDLTGTISQAAAAHDKGFSRSSDEAHTIISAPQGTYSTPVIFNGAGTMTTAQIAQAHDWMLAATAPNPLPMLPTADATTTAGMRYAEAARIDNARLVVPQETMGFVTSLHAPTINVGTWATDTWDAMTDQSSGAPPGVVNGRISDNALIRLQVDSRYANPSWYGALMQKDTVGVLREIALMDAVRMHMRYEQLRLTERMAVMMAQEVSEDANRTARREAGAISAQTGATTVPGGSS